mmetsp:Transcript_45944/g.89767  ORF Transcript_45944/g.89767 Transcript_45944/m.89767 type:complete len:218 (-) Transcript_45944:2296-2949(-)
MSPSALIFRSWIFITFATAGVNILDTRWATSASVSPKAVWIRSSGCSRSVIWYARSHTPPGACCSPSLTVIPSRLASRSFSVSFVNVCISLRACASSSSPRTGTDMVGVERFLEAVMMISRSRGMPRVTFAPEPARWKVLRVICVDGSPTDWPAMHPTASPGAQSALPYFDATIFRMSPALRPAARSSCWRTLSSSSILWVARATCSETHAPLVPRR